MDNSDASSACWSGGCTSGSGSQGPEYASRTVFSARSRSIAIRVAVVTSQASGWRIPSRSAWCQRT